MTHDPKLAAELAIRQSSWAEIVAGMSAAERAGFQQSVFDSAAALDLVVIPKERLGLVTTRFDDDERVLLAVPIAEYKARQMLQAAQALAQLAIEAGALTWVERRNVALGRREIRYALRFVLPPAEVVETAKPGLLSVTEPATT